MTNYEQPEAEPEPTGIVMELARDDVERKKFLRMAGKGMGSAAAATSLAAFIAACGSSKTKTSTVKSTPAPKKTSSASSGSSDLKIVNYALTLEYLEAAFYKKVAASKLFSGSTLTTLKSFGAEEEQHVLALHKVATELGTPAPEPKTKFTLGSATAVAKLAATVENLGANAYLGQAPYIKSTEILAAALAIHSIEARHAATLNILTKQNPSPQGAFAKGLTMSQVLPTAEMFIVK